MNRALTVGEHNLISNALFLRQEALRKQAHEYRVMAMSLAAKLGDDNDEVRRGAEYANGLEAEARAVFNLEMFVRRYTINIEAPLALPEQA